MNKKLLLQALSFGLSVAGAAVTLVITDYDNKELESKLTEKIMKNVMDSMNKVEETI